MNVERNGCMQTTISSPLSSVRRAFLYESLSGSFRRGSLTSVEPLGRETAAICRAGLQIGSASDWKGISQLCLAFHSLFGSLGRLLVSHEHIFHAKCKPSGRSKAWHGDGVHERERFNEQEIPTAVLFLLFSCSRCGSLILFSLRFPLVVDSHPLETPGQQPCRNLQQMSTGSPMGRSFVGEPRVAHDKPFHSNALPQRERESMAKLGKVKAFKSFPNPFHRSRELALP